MTQARRWLPRRRRDYLAPVLIAILSAISTGATQMAMDSASHAATREYWRLYYHRADCQTLAPDLPHSEPAR